MDSARLKEQINELGFMGPLTVIGLLTLAIVISPVRRRFFIAETISARWTAAPTETPNFCGSSEQLTCIRMCTRAYT